MPVKQEVLADFGIRNITQYATEVNLDRAIPELYDGLKPVLRRAAWSAHQFKAGEAVKSAKVVGQCIGSYHPHGDSSVYGAMQTMVHHNVPLLEGVGNWGTIIDPAAAYRYTNCKLSKFGNSIFDPNYKAVMDTVPNFDNSTAEPVVLPVRLPLLVLNGGEGIGVGITASIPTFTVESVVKVLTLLLSGKKLEAKDYAKILKSKQHWGGHLVDSQANKKAWLELMQTGRAKVQFEPELDVDESKKTITISEWPAGLNPIKFIQKVRALSEVQRAQNSKGSMTFTIEIKKGYNLTQFQELVNKVRKLSVSTESYRLNVTHRVSKTEDGVTTYDTKFLALSIPEFFETWCKLRLQLEKKSLGYQITKQQEAIDYHELLIFASNNLSVIFKALRQSDSCSYLMKNLKLTEKQANQILDLKVRNLSKLDQSVLKLKLKDLKKVMDILQGYMKKPKTKVKSEFSELLALIETDKKSQNLRDNQELTVK